MWKNWLSILWQMKCVNSLYSSIHLNVILSFIYMNIFAVIHCCKHKYIYKFICVFKNWNTFSSSFVELKKLTSFLRDLKIIDLDQLWIFVPMQEKVSRIKIQLFRWKRYTKKSSIIILCCMITIYKKLFIYWPNHCSINNIFVVDIMEIKRFAKLFAVKPVLIIYAIQYAITGPISL